MDEPPEPVESFQTPDYSGRLLGDYRLLRRLGRGGMADVYLAEQQSLARQVAIKILRPSLAKNEAYIRRFMNEARAAAALIHTNIVQVFEVGVRDGLHYIAQEYVAGQNVRQLLAKSGPLSARLTINIMRQVAAGLHRAGREGIIHRDIKPENIMLTKSGEAKVADFGLARFSNTDADTQLTQIGVTMGTPLYMSPEQVEGRSVDKRTDLYSFGVTFYHVLAGHPPFQGDTPLSIAIQHVRNEPERLESVRPDVPEGLCRIIHKLLAKRPEDRYAEASEVLRDLRELSQADDPNSWPTGSDEWVTQEMVEQGEARGAAAQKLSTLMQAESRMKSSHSRLGFWSAACVLGLLLGSGGAFALRPGGLLENRARQRSAIERMGSVQDQYLLAVSLGTEQAFRSVEEYFPRDENSENRHYARLAQQHLADTFLDAKRYEEALAEYESLALDPATRTVGLIGLVNANYRQENSGQSWQEKVVELARLAAAGNIENHVLAMRDLDAEPRNKYEQIRETLIRPESRQIDVGS